MSKRKTPNDYKFIRILGEGSFSSVYLAVDKDITRDKLQELKRPQFSTSATEELEIHLNTVNDNTTSHQHQAPASTTKIRKYAVKVCQKSYIKRQNKQAAIMREKTILEILNQHSHKHLIKLYCTFQDYERLYFVMTYAENGDLLTYMLQHPLSLDSVRTYTLQLVSALEHMHRLQIVHRDLKPENILLNSAMEILVTDFGSAQIDVDADDLVNPSADRRNSFVGTAQYVSPEMLKSKCATNKSDLWALGIIIYQLITNIMPFNAGNEYLIYQKIQALDYHYPNDFDKTARDLVESLIKLEPMERLGATDDLLNKGYPSITSHPFFDRCNEGSFEKEAHISIGLDFDQDSDFNDIDNIKPGLNEPELLRLLIGARG